MDSYEENNSKKYMSSAEGQASMFDEDNMEIDDPFDEDEKMHQTRMFGDMVETFEIDLTEKNTANRKEKISDIAKWACGMANSFGGVLVLNNYNCKKSTRRCSEPFLKKIDEELNKLCAFFSNSYKRVGSYESRDIYVYIRKVKQGLLHKYGSLYKRLHLENREFSEQEKIDIIFSENNQINGQISTYLYELHKKHPIEKICERLEESQEIEFKHHEPILTCFNSFGKRSFNFRKSISAFANTGGGKHIIGIKERNDSDITEIIGYDLTEHDKNSIECMIINQLNTIVWGCEAKRYEHWDLKFELWGGRYLIVVTVAAIEGTGGVYISEKDLPELYYCEFDTNNCHKTNLKPKTFRRKKIYEESRETMELALKMESCSISTYNIRIVKIRDSIEKIQKNLFQVEKGCPLTPPYFTSKLSYEAGKALINLRNLLKKEFGIGIISHSWLTNLCPDNFNVFLNKSPLCKNVICDILFVIEKRGIFLLTLTHKKNQPNDHDVLNHNKLTALILKQLLIEMVNCSVNFGITCEVIDCITLNNTTNNRTTKYIFPTSPYPAEYNELANINGFLRSLIQVIAVFPSSLHTRLGTTFLNTLTYEQFRFLLSIIDNNDSKELWLKGPPGTGKTVVAVEFIRKLIKEDPNCKVLYVCENRGLRSTVERTLNRNTATCVCMQTFRNWPENYYGYHHVIMDEAHHFRESYRDFNFDWLSAVRNIVYESGGHLWVIVDNSQKIHRYPTGLPLPRYQIPEHKLKYIIRNSGAIHKFSQRYNEDTSGILGHDWDGDDPTLIAVEPSAIISTIFEQLGDLKKDGYLSSDIAILFNGAKHLDQYEASINEFCNRMNWKTSDEEDNNLPEYLILSTRKYAGLDRAINIVVDPYLRYGNVNPYMLQMFTRSMIKLIVIHDVDNEYFKNLY